MAKILATVLSDGLAAVETACAEALIEGVSSADVIINIVSRHRRRRLAPDHHHDAGRADSPPRADRRLRPLRQPQKDLIHGTYFGPHLGTERRIAPTSST